MKVLKYFGRFLLIIVAVCIVAAGVMTYKGYEMYKDAVDNKSVEEMVGAIRQKPGYTTIDELPQTYIHAVISVEDHRFYNHSGIDIIAIGRAVWNDIKAGSLVEGGSTITQQLAKNLYFSQEKKLTRKIAEVFMAFQLEKKYSKDEIFELYVNSIYFGEGYYCIRDASLGYFGKLPSQMNDYECTLLAGIPNAPSAYNPKTNPELAAKRQKQVLNQMVAYQYLSTKQAETIQLSLN